MTMTREITTSEPPEELVTMKVTKATQTGLRILKGKKDKSMQAIMDELVRMELYRIEQEEQGKLKRSKTSVR